MTEYAELHCHSGFSLLDGASPPEALLERAAELGLPALALTEHDGLYGAPRFVLAARQRGVHPVIGAELTLASGAHLVVLAENDTGYANLCWLISRAQLGESKGQARLPLHLLEGRNDGLIALTGCRRGPLAGPLLRGEPEETERALGALLALFGRGCLYVELQQHLEHRQDRVNEALAELAGRQGLPLVATNNVHYARRAGHRLHEVLTCIRRQCTLDEAGRLLRPNSELHLKSAAEMRTLFHDYPQAVAASTEIARRCQVSLDFRRVGLPAVAVDGEGSEDEWLARLCEENLERAYGRDQVAARRQLDHELKVIRATRLAGFFLTVWDIMRFARERGIRAQGRGSAANSIVAYLLGITRVDPLAHHLLFERFLSAEARVMPDIDIDFCSRRREEVIQYVYDTYGESHVGMVCNYITYRGRSAVRDVGKALGLPADVIDRVASGLGKWGEERIEEAAARALGTSEGIDGHIWELFISLCDEIQGLPRHLGIHVGGLCVTRAPLDQVVPLEHATMPGRVVIQWDKDCMEDAGLIKIDLLSLRTLTAVEDCVTMIRAGSHPGFDLDRVPADDPAVYDALQRADTVGAFQVESRAQQQALVQMRPANLADLVIEVALIRPGPLQGNMVHPFLRRRQGTEVVRYFHPILEPILKETLGVVVFQEQVIRVAMVMGRFSAGEADALRRAMSRHRSVEEMEGFRRRFVAGAEEQGILGETAEEVFDKLAGFASFGFCKSHAAAFAQLAYETLYLRAHYPAEYYCALLNNQPMGFYPPRALVGDARRHGVALRQVHVNRSEGKCSLEDGAIRLGLEYVDGMGEGHIGRVLESRAQGRFRNLGDFCRRTGLPRALAERLILAGGMDDWCRDRRRLVWELGRLRYREGEFDLAPAEDVVPLERMERAEALLAEYGVVGMPAEGHLLELFRERLTADGVLSSRELQGRRQEEWVRVAGMLVIRQAPPTAKGFVFLTLEDEWGLINVIVRPDVFRAQRTAWSRSRVMVVAGRVQQANGRVDLLAERVWEMG